MRAHVLALVICCLLGGSPAAQNAPRRSVGTPRPSIDNISHVVSGTIVDFNNRPVAGAIVRVGSNWGEVIQTAAKTDANGFFRCEFRGNLLDFDVDIRAPGLARRKLVDIPLGPSDVSLGILKLEEASRLI